MVYGEMFQHVKDKNRTLFSILNKSTVSVGAGREWNVLVELLNSTEQKSVESQLSCSKH